MKNHERFKKFLTLLLRGQIPYLFFKLKRKLHGFVLGLRASDTHFLYHRDNGEVLPDSAPPWHGPKPTELTGFQEVNRFRYMALKQLGLLEKTRLHQTVDTHNRIFQKRSKWAVVLHLYYPEMFFKDISPCIETLGENIDLFISINGDISSEYVEEILKKYPQSFFLISPNHGRDIFPFLKIFPLVQDYEWVGKIHTKKSLHQPDGDLWRTQIFSSLFNRKVISQLQTLSPDTGIAAPRLSLLHLDIFIHGNETLLRNLEKFYKLPAALLSRTKFVMGTMFWFRPQALAPLLHHSEDEFSPFFEETGALDNTYAHAYERLFAHMAQSQHFKVIELNP